MSRCCSGGIFLQICQGVGKAEASQFLKVNVSFSINPKDPITLSDDDWEWIITSSERYIFLVP